MADKRRALTPAFLAACGVGIGILVAFKRYNLIFRIKDYFLNPLRHKHVQIVTTVQECQQVVTRLRKDVNKYRVLGFDCEWLTVDGNRRPVALLQLASDSGLCALIRLCQLKHVPGDLQQLLEDETILKVGVAPLDDAKYLFKDYNVQVRSTLDLRHLASTLERPPEGLAKLSKSFIGVELNKNWRIRCSSWDNPILTEAQVDYASNDSLVAIEIYKKMYTIYGDREGCRNDLEGYMRLSRGFQDRPFKYNGPKGVPGLTGKKNFSLMTTQKRNLATRSKPLYDNCFMEAPDGELLCTMDRRKAEWYRKRGLATLVCEDPIRMRLSFEPSGRAVGQTGLYDLGEKVNQCVACGSKENFSRKFIIPQEYRRFFPVVMKSHSSHDILLLCQECHRTSNMEDNRMREKLAILCGAPLICHIKKLKIYSTALLKGNLLDTARDKMMEYIVDFHPSQEITDEFLKELSQLDTKSKAGDNSGHAEKVTEYFKNTPDSGGLLELEKMWREHFLDAMKPRFLPDHWSTVHTANRLERLRNDAGRVDIEDLIVAGLDPIVVLGEEERSPLPNAVGQI